MSPTQKRTIGDSPRKRLFKAQHDDGGFILVTVLLIIALLFPIVLAFNSKVQLSLIQAENFRNSVQALRMARSGVEGAIGILKMDDASYDSPKDRWGMGFPALAFGEGATQGILAVTIVDEDGKIPVNRLIKDTTGASQLADTGSSRNESQAAKKAEEKKPEQKKTDGPTTVDEVDRDMETRLRSLITRLGGNPQIVDALIDWLDADNEITGSEGAENDYYKRLGYQCKNGPLDSLDELLSIKGFDRELVIDRKLMDYLTVAPTDGRINVNTAPLEALQVVLGTKTTSLAQPLSESDIEDLHRYREEHELKTARDIGSAIKISQDQLGKISSLVKVNSSYFTVTSRYTIGKVDKTVEAVLKRDGSTVTTISWREF
jgi:general secretion pathway protein K